MFELQNLILLCVFSAFSAAAYWLLVVCDPYMLRIRSRLNALQAQGTAFKPAAQTMSRAPIDRIPKSKRLMDYLAPLRFGDHARMQQRLIKAGIYHPAALSRLFVARLVLMTVPPLIAAGAGFAGYVRMDTAILIGCVAGGMGSLLPSMWLDRAVARHHMLLRKSLPDFLDLMIVCLEGGLSLQETLRRVSDELRLVHPALAFELGIVQRDVELGATVDQGLRRFASRTDYEGVRTLSTFIREAQRFGTNITEALRHHADLLRLQREQAAEENAQKASVKILLPTLLLIFPAIFVVLVGPAVIQIQETFGGK